MIDICLLFGYVIINYAHLVSDLNLSILQARFVYINGQRFIYNLLELEMPKRKIKRRNDLDGSIPKRTLKMEDKVDASKSSIVSKQTFFFNLKWLRYIYSIRARGGGRPPQPTHAVEIEPTHRPKDS